MASFYKRRKILLATMHGKEKTIAPKFAKAMQVELGVPENFNTDQFGTFSGEIERANDPLETARRKCEVLHYSTGCNFVLASEGSFGPHPTMFFVPCDDEILVFRDFEHDLEIKARLISTKTNFCGIKTNCWGNVVAFAKRVKFPSHSLILRPKQDSIKNVVKGISSWGELRNVYKKYHSQTDGVFIEPDMRAMHNPTRMRVISEVTDKLIKLIETCCPECNTPGFGISDAVSGLPCEQCALPTRSTLTFIHFCQKCGYKMQQDFPHNKRFENPMFCDWCNP